MSDFSMYEMRQWLETMLKANGAKVTGAGVGFGQADIDFDLNGKSYRLAIGPAEEEEDAS